MSRVLFVCGENSARSQMAEAYFNDMAHTWEAESAGTLPGAAINPLAVQAMAEDEIDISRASPQPLDLSRLDAFARIISFGCIVKSVFPARDRLEEWPLDDPGKGDMALMRGIRDEIKRRVSQLVAELEGKDSS
jgi:protein-tyrosine-phosphatase